MQDDTVLTGTHQPTAWQRLLLTRRSVLAAMAGSGVAVAATTLGASPAAAVVSLDEFMELSEVLTDRVGRLRDEAGAQYLAALQADPAHAEPLERLVQVAVRRNNPPDTFEELVDTGVLDNQANAETAQQVLIYWYSGIVHDRTAEYIDALAWGAQDFAEPPSTELGFPDWEDRP